MKPGRKYETIEHDGECLRCAVASTTGIARSRVPFVNPKSSNFWRRWRENISALGYSVEVFNPNGENEPDGFWIGFVHAHPGREMVTTNHAVVMRGKKLHWDPNIFAPRKHRPHHFDWGWKLVPDAD